MKKTTGFGRSEDFVRFLANLGKAYIGHTERKKPKRIKKEGSRCPSYLEVG